MTRKLQLTVEILRALESCVPYAMPEETLSMQAGILLGGPRVLQSEFIRALKELERLHCVVGVRGDLDADEIKWAITANGKAKLAEYSGS